jgi:hypothetical protein
MYKQSPDKSGIKLPGMTAAISISDCHDMYLMRDALATKQRHQGAGHRRNQFLLSSLYPKCLSLTNRDGSAGLQDMRPKKKIVTPRRG